MPTKKTATSIYQLKITLRDSRPPIWRRVLVPSNFTLLKLHKLVQAAMGWTDSHLHQFQIGGNFYGTPSAEDWEPVLNERQFTLEQIAPSVKFKFFYEYDFGDSWMHEIMVEKIQLPSPDEKYPHCIKGKRACPPEDVGGICGYENMLDALRDESHEEHESYLEWLGEGFDPDALDLDVINKDLRRIK